MPTHLETDSCSVSEIDDRYMEAMVVRVVPPFHPDLEDAMQVARIQRWLYRDSLPSWQANQIKWRVTDMMREYHGRTHPTLEIMTGTAIPLSAILPGNYLPLTETVSEKSGRSLVEHVSAKMDATVRLQRTMEALNTEKTYGLHGKRNVDWMMRHAQGETMKSIACSAGCSESTVCASIAAIRKRLRETVAA